MPRITEIVGKSVIRSQTGDRLGRVDELLLDAEHARVEGVVIGVDWRSVLGHGRVLPFSALQRLGHDAVIASGDAEPMELADWRRAGHPTDCPSASLKGKPVITSDGDRIGTVTDALVDPETGRVDSLEVTPRGAAGSSRAPSRIPVTPGVRIGEDMIVVPDDRPLEGELR